MHFAIIYSLFKASLETQAGELDRVKQGKSGKNWQCNTSFQEPNSE